MALCFVPATALEILLEMIGLFPKVKKQGQESKHCRVVLLAKL